jgi:hypothetical protein
MQLLQQQRQQLKEEQKHLLDQLSRYDFKEFITLSTLSSLAQSASEV